MWDLFSYEVSAQDALIGNRLRPGCHRIFFRLSNSSESLHFYKNFTLTEFNHKQLTDFTSFGGCAFWHRFMSKDGEPFSALRLRRDLSSSEIARTGCRLQFPNEPLIHYQPIVTTSSDSTSSASSDKTNTSLSINSSNTSNLSTSGSSVSPQSSNAPVFRSTNRTADSTFRPRQNATAPLAASTPVSIATTLNSSAPTPSTRRCTVPPILRSTYNDLPLHRALAAGGRDSFLFDYGLFPIQHTDINIPGWLSDPRLNDIIARIKSPVNLGNVYAFNTRGALKNYYALLQDPSWFPRLECISIIDCNKQAVFVNIRNISGRRGLTATYRQLRHWAVTPGCYIKLSAFESFCFFKLPIPDTCHQNVSQAIESDTMF